MTVLGERCVPGIEIVLILANSVALLTSIFAVLTGLAFGSFLNVCISRLPHHESVVSPRSRCPHCSTPILNRDNVPLLSWFWLRGRCRSCGARISARYPLVEAAAASLFLLCFLEFGPTPTGVAAAVLCWLLLGLAAMDAETMRLPDAFTLPGIALGLLASWLEWKAQIAPRLSLHALAESAFWAASAAALILMIRSLYWLVRRREGIGLGDAKLLAMIAAWLGPARTALVLFLAVVAASVYGLALIARGERRLARADRFAVRVPLGAFLCAAALLSLFEGDAMLTWYLGYFH